MNGVNISSILRRYKISLLLEDVVFNNSEKEIIDILNRECQKYLDISDKVIIEEFNHWFKYSFENYDGRKGAIGIFLRTDKLSSNWVKEYLISIGQDVSYENVEHHYQIVRKNWKTKLSS